MITNCGKFLKRWEYQTTLPVFQETCIQNKKQQNLVWNNRLVHNRERSMSRLNIVTVYYTLYIMRNGRLDDSQNKIKIARRTISNLRHADDTRKGRGTKETLEGERGE